MTRTFARHKFMCVIVRVSLKAIFLVVWNTIPCPVWLAVEFESNSRFSLVRSNWILNSCKMTELPFLPFLLNFIFFFHLCV